MAMMASQLFLGEVFERRYVLNAGVIYKNVNLSELPHGLLCKYADGIGLLHVGIGEEMSDLKFIGHALRDLGAIRLKAVKNNIVPLCGKGFSDTQANARGRAGDKNSFFHYAAQGTGVMHGAAN